MQADKAPPHRNESAGANTVHCIDGQTLIGKLVADGQALEMLALRIRIAHKVLGPDVSCGLMRQRASTSGSGALVWLLARLVLALAPGILGTPDFHYKPPFALGRYEYAVSGSRQQSI